jgi:hypothetical protein
MQDVPKIVVKRLQSPAAEAHPDADLLTAFAEQSLAGQERDQVLHHLARCGDCREAVALALPAQIELPMPALSGAIWLRWPVLRWAAVAAGVVLIASIGTIQYRRQRPKELASNLFDQKRATATPASGAQPSLPATVPQNTARGGALAEPRAQTALAENKSASPQGTVLNGRALSAGAIHGASHGATIGGPMRFDSASRRDFGFAPAPGSAPSAPAAAQNPTPRPGNQVVEASGASQAVEVQSQAATINVQSNNEVVQLEQPSADRQEAVEKAKPTSPQSSLSTLAPAPSLHSEPGLLKGPGAPRWTISATGTLQRSLDGGKTWLDVNVAVDQTAANFTPSAQAGANAEMTAETQTMARSAAPAEVKSRRKQSAPAVTPIFHALSVSDNPSEVWAGGSGAALYHTVDAGKRWTRVMPSAAGIVLTGDIIRIQFSDARSGTVTTSTSEVWTTSDDGQTWRKQQ